MTTTRHHAETETDRAIGVEMTLEALGFAADIIDDDGHMHARRTCPFGTLVAIHIDGDERIELLVLDDRGWTLNDTLSFGDNETGRRIFAAAVRGLIA